MVKLLNMGMQSAPVKPPSIKTSPKDNQINNIHSRFYCRKKKWSWHFILVCKIINKPPNPSVIYHKQGLAFSSSEMMSRGTHLGFSPLYNVPHTFCQVPLNLIGHKFTCIVRCGKLTLWERDSAKLLNTLNLLQVMP